MKLVVDSNILVSFFRPNPVSMIIYNSKFFDLDLSSPTYVIEELRKNKKDILKYSNINLEQLNEKLSELSKLIKIFSIEEYKKFKKEAKKISPHDKDIPIFALALKLNCAIWSNEPEFKQQSKIKVFSTKDIIELMF